MEIQAFMKRHSLLILFLFVLTGFSKKVDDAAEFAGKQVVVTEAGDDILIPTELWKMLEDPDYKKQQKKTGGSNTNQTDQEHSKTEDDHSSSEAMTKVTEDVSVQFIPLKVTFTEKNPGVLKQPAIQYVLPNGGGHIDLSKVVGTVSGSFFVKVEVDLDPKDSPSYWFVSRSKKRRIEGEIWGGGCNTFYSLDKFAEKQLFTGEFLVNTTRDRHVTLLGGSFLFASRKSRDIKIAHLTFSDTTKDQLFCENRANE